MSAVHCDTHSAARTQFKDLLDAAGQGEVATVRRGGRMVVIVDADRLLATLMKARPANTMVVPEEGAWTVILPGVPIASQARTIDDAIVDAIDALREYADDWADRLSKAPNHAQNWDLAQLVGLATDQQLRTWINATH